MEKAASNPHSTVADIGHRIFFISLSRDLSLILSRYLEILSRYLEILSRYLEIFPRYLEIFPRYMEIKSHKIGKSHVFLSNTRGSYTITTMNGDRVELISVYHSLGFTQGNCYVPCTKTWIYIVRETSTPDFEAAGPFLHTEK